MILLVRIAQGQDTNAKVESQFAQLLENLHEAIEGETITFELQSFRQHTYFYVSISDRVYELVSGQIYAVYPECEIEHHADYAAEDLLTQGHLGLSVLGLRRIDLYPTKRFSEFEGDSLAGIFAVLSKAREGEQLWVQLIVSPRKDSFGFNFRRSMKTIGNRMARWFRFRDRIKARAQPEFRSREMEAISSKTKERQFFVEVKIAAFCADREKALGQLHALEQAFAQFNTIDFNGFRMASQLAGAAALRAYAARSFDGGGLFGISEIASLYHFPNPEVVPHIVHVLSRKAEPPRDLPRAGMHEVLPFGVTNFHNQQIPFGLLRGDRSRHLYVVGKSGTGKSKLLELLIATDLRNGQGVCVMDPHGDLVDAVLKHVPKERIADVILFSPTDTEYPLPFNPMQAVDPNLKLRVTIGFIEIFKKLFGANWTPRLEHVLRQTTLALLDSPGTTVFSILKMLSDKNYRQTIVARIQDSVVKNFWVNEFAAWSEKFDNEAITPLLNKVGQLVSTNLIRNIVGQPFNSFDIADIMNQGKIFLVKINKGLLGEENAQLLGAMIITKIQQAALQRATIPEEERRPFYLYCDEFQYFATDTFAEMLSEARKYHLSLTCAHQYMGQLIDKVRTTIFGNVGTIISFRVGAEDSVILEKEYTPIFGVRDIINLGVREFYVKMSIAGETRDAFSGRTVDVVVPREDPTPEIVAHSRKTYARPKQEVELLLRKWDESGGDISQEAWFSGALDAEFAAPIV